jgi:hypothetical protein
LAFLAAESNHKIGDTIITNHDILDTVIYGELAHSNKQKEMVFAQWTRWPTHERILWFTFNHVLRYSMELLQHFRDVNATTLMAHFGVLPTREIFNRLQSRSLLRADASPITP